jgi:hypothetical protein
LARSKGVLLRFGGAQVARLQNEKGVILEVHGVQVGFQVSLGLAGMPDSGRAACPRVGAHSRQCRFAGRGENGLVVEDDGS